MQLSFTKIVSFCILLLLFPFSILSSEYYSFQPLKTKSSAISTEGEYNTSIISFEEKLHMYPKNYNKKLIQYIKKECLRSQVPFSLVCAIIKKESQWNVHCHSDNLYNKKVVSTDYGLMQLNSKYSKGFVYQFKDAWRTSASYDIKNNPYDNVQVGIRHLRFLYDQLGNWKKTVMAYNAGINRVINKNIPKSTIEYVKEVCPTDGWWILYSIED